MTHVHDQTSLAQADIISGCLRGDGQAQRALYAHTSDRAYRLLLRLTRNAEDAADLLQETYVRVFSRLDRFQGASSLSTWVYQIALNEARQFFRRHRRYERALREELPGPAESQAGGEEALAVGMDVREAVARLPEEERTLIVLRYFEGLDYARMAEVLDKPAGTIASGLNRARRMLQDVLGEKL